MKTTRWLTKSTSFVLRTLSSASLTHNKQPSLQQTCSLQLTARGSLIIKQHAMPFSTFTFVPIITIVSLSNEAIRFAIDRSILLLLFHRLIISLADEGTLGIGSSQAHWRSTCQLCQTILLDATVRGDSFVPVFVFEESCTKGFLVFCPPLEDVSDSGTVAPSCSAS
jgi:hypothetical protein